MKRHDDRCSCVIFIWKCLQHETTETMAFFRELIYSSSSRFYGFVGPSSCYNVFSFDNHQKKQIIHLSPTHFVIDSFIHAYSSPITEKPIRISHRICFGWIFVVFRGVFLRAYRARSGQPNAWTSRS